MKLSFALGVGLLTTKTVSATCGCRWKANSLFPNKFDKEGGESEGLTCPDDWPYVRQCEFHRFHSYRVPIGPLPAAVKEWEAGAFFEDPRDDGLTTYYPALPFGEDPFEAPEEGCMAVGSFAEGDTFGWLKAKCCNTEEPECDPELECEVDSDCEVLYAGLISDKCQTATCEAGGKCVVNNLNGGECFDYPLDSDLDAECNEGQCKAGECVAVPTDVECNFNVDGEEDFCTTGDMCVAGVCSPVPPVINPDGFVGELDIEYKTNSLQAFYLDQDTTDGDPMNDKNIYMEFTYSKYGPADCANPVGGADATDGCVPASFAAVIFEGPNCGGDNLYIGSTSNADVTPYTAHSPPDLFTNVAIDATNPLIPVLTFNTPLNNFDLPFWNQNFDCSAAFGDAENLPEETCGRLEFCVEFQVLLDDCDKKIDFVDVMVQVELDIEVDCETDCVDVLLQRAMPSEAKDDADAGFPIKCEPCEALDGGEYDGLGAEVVNQGDTMTACLRLEDTSLEHGIGGGACILDVEILELVIDDDDDDDRFQIWPVCNEDNCLFSAGNGLDLYEAGVYRDGATIDFQPPAWVFQEVVPGGSVIAHFEGTVILGFGTFCEDPDRRKLQETRKLQEPAEAFMVNIAGSPFIFENGEAPPSSNGCGWATLLA
jgi:hypothetical protein